MGDKIKSVHFSSPLSSVRIYEDSQGTQSTQDVAEISAFNEMDENVHSGNASNSKPKLFRMSALDHDTMNDLLLDHNFPFSINPNVGVSRSIDKDCCELDLVITNILSNAAAATLDGVLVKRSSEFRNPLESSGGESDENASSQFSANDEEESDLAVFINSVLESVITGLEKPLDLLEINITTHHEKRQSSKRSNTKSWNQAKPCEIVNGTTAESNIQPIAPTLHNEGHGHKRCYTNDDGLTKVYFKCLKLTAQEKDESNESWLQNADTEKRKLSLDDPELREVKRQKKESETSENLADFTNTTSQASRMLKDHVQHTKALVCNTLTEDKRPNSLGVEMVQFRQKYAVLSACKEFPVIPEEDELDGDCTFGRKPEDFSSDCIAEDCHHFVRVRPVAESTGHCTDEIQPEDGYRLQLFEQNSLETSAKRMEKESCLTADILCAQNIVKGDTTTDSVTPTPNFHWYQTGKKDPRQCNEASESSGRYKVTQPSICCKRHIRIGLSRKEKTKPLHKRHFKEE